MFMRRNLERTFESTETISRPAKSHASLTGAGCSSRNAALSNASNPALLAPAMAPATTAMMKVRFE
jgi:hypothetical protein